MPLRIVFRPQAEGETLAVCAWYESRRTGLGREFAEAVDALLDRMAASLGPSACARRNPARRPLALPLRRLLPSGPRDARRTCRSRPAGSGTLADPFVASATARSLYLFLYLLQGFSSVSHEIWRFGFPKVLGNIVLPGGSTPTHGCLDRLSGSHSNVESSLRISLSTYRLSCSFGLSSAPGSRLNGSSASPRC